MRLYNLYNSTKSFAQNNSLVYNYFMKNNFVKTPVKSIISVTAFYTVHYFNYGRKFSFEGESHNFWELVYVDRGKATIVADDRNYELNQGEAYFHKPNQFHSIKTVEFASSIIVTFSLAGDASFFEDRKAVLSPAQQVMLGNIISEFSRAFSDAPDEIYMRQLHFRDNPPAGTVQMMRCYLECLLISLMRGEKSGQTVIKAKNDAELTVQIKSILGEKLYSSVTLEEISKRLYFSKTYLGAKFKADVGCSIISYYNKIKTDEAKRLIAAGQYSLSQIAAMLGYGSAQYFTRIFKKNTHFTPSEWAKCAKVDNLLH